MGSSGDRDGSLYRLQFSSRQLYCVPFRASRELLDQLVSQHQTGAEQAGSILWDSGAAACVVSAGQRSWNATCVPEGSCDVVLVPGGFKGAGACCEVGKAECKLQLQMTLDDKVSSKFKARNAEAESSKKERRAVRLEEPVTGSKTKVEARTAVRRVTPPPTSGSGGQGSNQNARPPALIGQRHGGSSGGYAAPRSRTPPPPPLAKATAKPALPRAHTPPPPQARPALLQANLAVRAPPPQAARAPTPPVGAREPTPPPGARGVTPPPAGVPGAAAREKPAVRPLELTPAILDAARANNLAALVCFILQDRPLTKPGLTKELAKLCDKVAAFKAPSARELQGALDKVAELRNPGKYHVRPAVLRALQADLAARNVGAAVQNARASAGPNDSTAAAEAGAHSVAAADAEQQEDRPAERPAEQPAAVQAAAAPALVSGTGPSGPAAGPGPGRPLAGVGPSGPPPAQAPARVKKKIKASLADRPDRPPPVQQPQQHRKEKRRSPDQVQGGGGDDMFGGSSSSRGGGGVGGGGADMFAPLRRDTAAAAGPPAAARAQHAVKEKRPALQRPERAPSDLRAPQRELPPSATAQPQRKGPPGGVKAAGGKPTGAAVVPPPRGGSPPGPPRAAGSRGPAAADAGVVVKRRPNGVAAKRQRQLLMNVSDDSDSGTEVAARAGNAPSKVPRTSKASGSLGKAAGKAAQQAEAVNGGPTSAAEPPAAVHPSWRSSAAAALPPRKLSPPGPATLPPEAATSAAASAAPPRWKASPEWGPPGPPAALAGAAAETLGATGNRRVASSSGAAASASGDAAVSGSGLGASASGGAGASGSAGDTTGSGSVVEGVELEEDDDYGEYARYLERQPRLAAAVETAEQFIAYRDRFYRKYKVYIKLNHKMEHLRRSLAALQASSDKAATAEDRKLLLQERRILGRRQSRCFQQWEKAFSTLHAELQSMKARMKEYADRALPPSLLARSTSSEGFSSGANASRGQVIH